MKGLKKVTNRRQFLRLLGLGTLGTLSAFAAPTVTVPQVITQQVELTKIVAGTPVVQTQQVIVTATSAPTAAPAAVQMMGFNRSETVFAQQLTGTNATPTNFNFWAGWRQQDRGMQQVMNEPLWVDDFEAGKEIDALAAEPPTYSADFKTL